MSRLTALAFLVMDVSLTIANLVHSTLTLATLLLAVAVSAWMGLCSIALRATLWPTYFWDNTEIAKTNTVADDWSSSAPPHDGLPIRRHVSSTD